MNKPSIATTTAIILTAGQGTRMKSKHPKVLHSILGRPMLAYLLDTLKAGGVANVVVVVGYQAEAVQKALKDYGVRFVVQEPQLDTVWAYFMRGLPEPDFPTRPREKSH